MHRCVCDGPGRHGREPESHMLRAPVQNAPGEGDVGRKLLGALILAVAMLVIGGCGSPTGTDGSLINQWQAMPEAKIPVPASGACYSVPGDPTSLTKWPEPVDCGVSHTVETIYVGTFTGEDFDRTSPPPSGGPGRR